MPRSRRPSLPGLVFHTVNRAAKRAPLLERSADYTAFSCVLEQAVSRFDIALLAYCLMPNHWHLIVRPQTSTLSQFMHWLETTHARRWQTARGLDGQGAVYQGRFKAVPVATDEHFLWVCRYVERNPVRAGLVARAEEWEWSSLWRRIHHSATECLSAWPIAIPANWVDHVNRPQTDAELQAFRQAMRVGEPFGTDDWRERLLIDAGTKRKRQRGRPRRCYPPTVLEK